MIFLEDDTKRIKKDQKGFWQVSDELTKPLMASDSQKILGTQMRMRRMICTKKEVTWVEHFEGKHPIFAARQIIPNPSKAQWFTGQTWGKKSGLTLKLKCFLSLQPHLHLWMWFGLWCIRRYHLRRGSRSSKGGTWNAVVSPSALKPVLPQYESSLVFPWVPDQCPYMFVLLKWRPDLVGFPTPKHAQLMGEWFQANDLPTTISGENLRIFRLTNWPTKQTTNKQQEFKRREGMNSTFVVCWCANETMAGPPAEPLRPLTSWRPEGPTMFPPWS